MAFRTPKLAIATSTLGHAAVIALLLFGWHMFSEIQQGGSGGSEGAVVSVWLTGPSGATVSDGTVRLKERSQRAKKIRTGQRESIETFSGAKSSGTGDGASGIAGHGTGAGTGSSSGNANDGSEVLAKIWKRIDRKKYYPTIAKRRGIEGSPKITFELMPDGSIKWVKLTRSCGTELLDDAAIETVRRATPLPFYPKPITLAVRYSIED